MATQFTLGMRASCSDGFCGLVRRMILDPVTRTVTHLVIATRHHSADGRLVPLDLVDAADGEIRVRCTLAEFECLDPAEEVELADYPGYGGSYEAAAAVQGYGDVGAMGAGGAGIGMSLRDEPRAVVSDTIPPGETDLAWHERVHAVDGEIGRIEGFVVNRADHKVTHVLLKEGHLWGRKEVAIPVSAVASVEHGIRLNITKRQVEDLPPRDQKALARLVEPIGVGPRVVRAECQVPGHGLGEHLR